MYRQVFTDPSDANFKRGKDEGRLKNDLNYFEVEVLHRMHTERKLTTRLVNDYKIDLVGADNDYKLRLIFMLLAFITASCSITYFMSNLADYILSSSYGNLLTFLLLNFLFLISFLLLMSFQSVFIMKQNLNLLVK